jgi:hypothetical protein
MPTTFISYRRADSANITGRIYDRLVERYGHAQVFKDVDSIPPGVNFPEYIAESIQASDVALVVIGPRWLDASVGWGRRRLDDPTDFVRIEIETALRLGVVVIPVLVDGASLPPARRLPESLRPLLQQNGLTARPDPDFARDMERVYAAIDYWQAQPRRPALAPSTHKLTPAPPTPEPTPATAPQVAPEAAPSVARRTVATAVAERTGIAASRPRHYTPRLAPLLALFSALLVIAVSTALIFNGTAQRLFNPPNVSATRTASAQASLRRSLTAATASAQAILATQPYTNGFGPCSTDKGRYSKDAPYYWLMVPSNDFTCSGTTTTVTIGDTGVNDAGISFYGLPYYGNASFPAAFTASMTIAFTTSGDPANNQAYCVQVDVALPSDSVNNGGRLLGVCRDGSWYYNTYPAASNRHQGSLTSPLKFVITVRANTVGISVNGQQLAPMAHFDGQMAAFTVGLYAVAFEGITVTNFTFVPSPA